MKRHRHTPEQIVRKLREGERLLNEGKDLTEVVALTQRFGVSERRACVVTGQHRSTQRLVGPTRPSEEDKLRRRLRAIARAHPRWGWKTAHSVLRREGWVINRKRTQRLWRDEGLRRPPPCRRNGPARRVAQSSCGPSTPTTCGPWTSSSTRPPIAGG